MRASHMQARKRAAAAATARHPVLLLACALLLLFTHRTAFAPLPVPLPLSFDLPTPAAVRALAPPPSLHAPPKSAPPSDAHPPVAIFVQVSASALSHLPRLLKRIYHPHNLYIIHLDTDIPARDGLAALHAANLSSNTLPANLHVLPSETVNYRGVSMVLNTISAMELALQLAPTWRWRYFVNLSAADYPLTSPTTLRELLAHSGPARPFLSRAPTASAAKMMRERMSYFAVDDALSFSPVKKAVVASQAHNPLANNLHLTPAFAEAWMILPRAFVAYAAHSPAARRTLLAFAYSLSAPEHYFATLIANSHFSKSVVAHSMRQIVWSHRGRSAGQHPFYLDVLYDEELARDPPAAARIAKVPLLFARKFRMPSSKLKDELDRHREDPEHVRAVTEHFYQKLGISPPPNTATARADRI